MWSRSDKNITSNQSHWNQVIRGGELLFPVTWLDERCVAECFYSVAEELLPLMVNRNIHRYLQYIQTDPQKETRLWSPAVRSIKTFTVLLWRLTSRSTFHILITSCLQPDYFLFTWLYSGNKLTCLRLRHVIFDFNLKPPCFWIQIHTSCVSH